MDQCECEEGISSLNQRGAQKANRLKGIYIKVARLDYFKGYSVVIEKIWGICKKTVLSICVCKKLCIEWLTSDCVHWPDWTSYLVVVELYTQCITQVEQSLVLGVFAGRFCHIYAGTFNINGPSFRFAFVNRSADALLAQRRSHANSTADAEEEPGRTEMKG